MKRFFARRRYKRAVDEALEHLAERRTDQARAAMRRAAEAADAAFDGRGVDVATVRFALASKGLEAGALEEALDDAHTAERALSSMTVDERSQSAPEEAPSLSQVRGLIAAILERQGVTGPDYDAALSAWAEAASADKDDEAAGAAHNQLGLSFARRGDREGAAPHFLSALEKRTRKFGPRGLPTLETLYNAATFRDSSRTLDVVAVDLERIVTALDRKRDKRESELFESALHNLAALKEEQGDTDAAQGIFERALSAKEARLGRDHIALRATLVRLAQIHHRDGRLIHALDLYERALVLARKEHGDEHPIVVAIEAWRAELTQGIGPEAIARKKN